MWKKWVSVGVVAAALLLVAARPAPEGCLGMAFGEVHYTHNSVCEHPWYPGMFLQYYLTDGCGKELFLYGEFATNMVGHSASARGIMLRNGGCEILHVRSLNVCMPPEP